MAERRPAPTTDLARLTTPSEADRADFGAAFERIVGLMAYLRSPDGCPWDREQDLKTLKPYLVEEAYEVLEAIDHGTATDHREELGDLLLQVIFQAEIRRQAGEFDAADVAHTIADKLVRRHPHVFVRDDGHAVPDAASVPASWEAIKRQEKGDRSAIGGVPRSLPGLLRAQKITEKASRVGFDWPSARARSTSSRRNSTSYGRRSPRGTRSMCVKSSATCCSRWSILPGFSTPMPRTL